MARSPNGVTPGRVITSCTRSIWAIWMQCAPLSPIIAQTPFCIAQPISYTNGWTRIAPPPGVLSVEATHTFAEACREHGARFVFVSSDWVFDGQEPFVDEDSPPHPVNFYGIMKFACERELASMDGLNFAVGRLAGIYGMNYSNPELLRDDNGLGFDLHNFIIKRLTRGQVAPVWMGPKTNDIAHPTLASDGAAQTIAPGAFGCSWHLPLLRQRTYQPPGYGLFAGRSIRH